MKYRVMTMLFTEADNENQIEGRVVTVISMGDIVEPNEDGTEEVKGVAVTCLVEFPDSALSVARMVQR